jgi:hypothetical protein
MLKTTQLLMKVIKKDITMLLGFNHCDKKSEINNLLGERFILAHGFKRFQPIIDWLYCFGACGKMGTHDRRRCSPHGSQEAEGTGVPIFPSRACPQ